MTRQLLEAQCNYFFSFDPAAWPDEKETNDETF